MLSVASTVLSSLPKPESVPASYCPESRYVGVRLPKPQFLATSNHVDVQSSCLAILVELMWGARRRLADNAERPSRRSLASLGCLLAQ